MTGTFVATGAVAQTAPTAAPAAAPQAPTTAAPAPPAAPPPSEPAAAPGAAPAPYYRESVPEPQPAPSPPPQAAPGIYVEQPPLPPPEPRTRHVHDGFYLRLSAGFGALGVDSDYGNLGNASISGSGLALDLLLGGTPAPGLVIGGGILLQEAFRPSYRYDFGGITGSGIADNAESDTLGYLLLGPMIDVFPSPTGGFHFGGLLGLARLGLSDPQGNASSGFGVSAWAGYMWWTSSQWSVGGLVRLSGAATTRTSEIATTRYDVTDATRAITIQFSAVYH